MIILRKLPERYSIPNESEICSLISLLLMQQKAKQSGNIDDDDNDNDNIDDNQTSSLPKEFIEYIKEEIEKAIEKETLEALKPSHLLAEAKKTF